MCFHNILNTSFLLPENELQQPGSSSVKKSEEKGIVTVHEVKCKLYVKSSDPEVTDIWKDKGTGQLSIKCKEGISKGTKESKPTIVIRNDVCSIMDSFWFLKSLLTLVMVSVIDWFAHLDILCSFDGFSMVGKVLLNALLYPGIKTNPQKNSLVAIFHTAGDDSGNNDSVVARTFLFRMKTEEDRNKLATAIQEYAPST
ncbi:hypothetical protein SADUNF_Sadunf03G0089100 [Salix dunnii]|uniref:RanBD1 domain-containing protein n=1 Tax=Salix dunnii TaxID=1413687 RepID=A0A835N1X9_9ROSI|nr:hypothetical protein SADUNF_Sadunf03G0089100 [Salix dunnii]